MAGDRPERVTFPDDIRIADWLLEPSLDRLSRNGTVVHLRPQLTNLLVLLAQHAGRTVSKDEILSTVWEGQFVAESGMTRCIAEIRQALEDDARDPKIVQTITKRGYRLMAPVERVSLPGADEGAAHESPP
jgi:transcriptional activator of cad operon